MALGLGGWVSREVSVDKTRELDLVFWTFQKHRPNGHVGMVLKPSRPNSELNADNPFHALAVTHASYKNGVILDSFRGSLITDMSKIRRLEGLR